MWGRAASEIQTLPLFLSLIYKRSHGILVNIATETTVKHFNDYYNMGNAKVSKNKTKTPTNQQARTTTKTDEIGSM